MKEKAVLWEKTELVLTLHTASPSYLADVGALGLGGPGDDARDGEARLAGVEEVGRVHLAGQRLDVAQDGHLHLQVGRLCLIHDETHQDVELLLVREGLSAEKQEKLSHGLNWSVSALLFLIYVLFRNKKQVEAIYLGS